MTRKFWIYLTLLIVVVASCYQIFGLLFVAGKKFFAAYVAGAIMAYAWQATARLIAKLRAKKEVKEMQTPEDELDFIEFVHNKRTPADIAYEQWLKERDAQSTKGNEQTEEVKC